MNRARKKRNPIRAYGCYSNLPLTGQDNRVHPVRSQSSMMTVTSNGGFAALMAAIIISVILLLLVTTLSLTGFSGRLNILDSEYKERSSALAEACVDTALLKLAANPSFGGGPLDVDVSGSNRCTYVVYNPSVDNPNAITIETTADFQHAVTNLRVKVQKSDLSVNSWEEVPTF